MKTHAFQAISTRTLSALAGMLVAACGNGGDSGSHGTESSSSAGGSSSTSSNGTSAPTSTSASSGAGSGNTSASSSSGGQPPVNGCDVSNVAAGTWQDLTPAALKPAQWCVPAGNAVCPAAGNVPLTDVLGSYEGPIATYGIHAFALDPSHPGTVYLGTSSLGIWKSTDCGGTWTHINNPNNDTTGPGADLDEGRNWTVVVDPVNPDTIYTTSGYATGGVYQSQDGGATWKQVLSADIMSVSGNGFVEKITIDPTDHEHLVISFHTSCTGTPIAGAATDGSGGWACLASGKVQNGVWKWTLTTNGEPWGGGDGPGQTLLDAMTWFYGSNGDGGLWRTTTAGVSMNGAPAWNKVIAGPTIGGIYIASDGSLFSGGYGGTVSRSTTGALNTWTTVAEGIAISSINGSIPMTDDGTTLYISRGAYAAEYLSAPLASLASPTPFTPIPVPKEMSQGGSTLLHDKVNHLLYSSNMNAGFWRLKTK